MRIRKQAREGSDRNSKAEQHCTVVIQLQNFSNFVKNCLFVLLAGRHSMGFLKRHNFNRYSKKSNSTWKIVTTNNVRIHTRPFKCGYCGKGFSRAWVLKGHIRMHTGEKPYQCSTCGGAFADRSNLRQLLQTHSAVKNYGCGNCTRSFTRKLYLENHQKKCGGSNGKNS